MTSAIRRVAAAMLLLGTLAGCATQFQPDIFESPYGFFSGIWHGFIFPFSLLGCLFIDSVHLIGKPNTGFFYGLGYFLGLTPLLGAITER